MGGHRCRRHGDARALDRHVGVCVPAVGEYDRERELVINGVIRDGRPEVAADVRLTFFSLLARARVVVVTATARVGRLATEAEIGTAVPGADARATTGASP